MFHSTLTSSSSSLYQWALFSVAGQAAGGGEVLQHYCRSSAAVHSTQLGITSSSTHGTRDQLQPWPAAAKSKPAVRLWSTCASSDLGFPHSRARSATGKRVAKTLPGSSAAYSRFCCTWAGANYHASPWWSVTGSRRINDCRNDGWVLNSYYDRFHSWRR